jgi:hypothetical protein
MLSLVFDVRSEVAGPVVVPLTGSPPFRLKEITGLTSASSTIDNSHVLVRLLGDRLMLSLCDLKGAIAVGEYTGSLTLVDDEDVELGLPIEATCKNALWWR